MQFTAEEVKELLKIYNDIPQMIAEEFATIRNCENEKNKISLPPVNLSGMPSGKGMSSDRTANTALIDQAMYYEDEIKRCYQRIADLRQKRDWVRSALDMLDRTDRLILQLAYIGPENRKQRCSWRAPTWREIARRVGYCESQVQRRTVKALLNFVDYYKRY